MFTPSVILPFVPIGKLYIGFSGVCVPIFAFSGTSWCAFGCLWGAFELSLGVPLEGNLDDSCAYWLFHACHFGRFSISKVDFCFL